jgi:type II secretory pathway pseudopilin PulG
MALIASVIVKKLSKPALARRFPTYQVSPYPMLARSRRTLSDSDSRSGRSRAGQSQDWRRDNDRAGTTLVELMLAVSLAGTACLAGLAGMLMALRTADSNLLSLQAAAAVRSVSEQLIAVNYLALFETELSADVPSNPGGTLTADIWNSRTDDFHHTPDNPRDDLQLKIKPSVTRITQTDGLDYAQIVLHYEWLDSSFFAPRTRSDTFTTLVAPISSF